MNVLLCLFSRDANILGQRKRSNAIHDAEVDRLCTASHHWRNHLLRHMKHLRCGDAMNIVVVEKRLNHIGVICHMCQHTQFNLRIVRIHQHTSLFCYKEPAHFAPQVRAHGDVL